MHLDEGSRGSKQPPLLLFGVCSAAAALLVEALNGQMQTDGRTGTDR